MPQIWMTYNELAGILDCTEAEARTHVKLEGLDKKISRDGKTRAKLNAVLVVLYIERLKTIDMISDRAVEQLRYVHGLLRSDDARAPAPQTSLARLR